MTSVLKAANLRGGSLMTGKVIVEARLANYTPLMAGGWDASVTGEDPETGAAVPGQLNLAKALAGKSRWLLRIALQTLGYACTQREAESACEARKIDSTPLSLIEYLYGSSGKGWAGAYKLVLRLEKPGANRYCTDKYFLEYVSATRYNLATMGAPKEERRARLPLRPNIGFTLRIERRLAGDGKNSVLDDLVAATAFIVVAILGLGQASARGFGRFIIKDHVLTKELHATKSIIEVLKSMHEAENAPQAKHKLKEALEKYLQAVERAAEALRCDKRCDRGIEYLDLNNIFVARFSPEGIQCIAGRLPRIGKGFQERPLVSRPPVYAALEAIAISTLKASWKTVNRQPRRGGGGYHTWVLGLPRMQKGPVRCRQYHRGGERVDLPTGYILLGGWPDEKAKKLKVIKEVKYDGRVVGFIASDEKACKAVKEETYSGGRRQSPFIMFPADRDGHLVAVVPIYPGDLEAVVESIAHSGGLAKASQHGQPEFMDAVRIAAVADIACRGVPRVTEKCNTGKYVNNRVQGVARPEQQPNTVPREAVLREAYKAALEFLKHILGG